MCCKKPPTIITVFVTHLSVSGTHIEEGDKQILGESECYLLLFYSGLNLRTEFKTNFKIFHGELGQGSQFKPQYHRGKKKKRKEKK
jgi:hypothetical protein